MLSPSSRRAWIEISGEGDEPHFGHVALLAEGVDRNIQAAAIVYKILGSPSSRRAWIEIAIESSWKDSTRVALLAEGVDRNVAWGVIICVLPTVALLAEGVDRNLSGKTAQ